MRNSVRGSVVPFVTPADEPDEHQAIPRWPLAWPIGWARTVPGRRVIADFRRTKWEDSTRTIVEQGQLKTESVRKQRTVALSIFDATVRLEKELERLGGQAPVLSTNAELRLDGRPRSDKEPDDPGAACYFRFKGRATVLACDRYRRVADNIAALAAHIDALRRIQRYGVGTIEQALAGYKALPADTAADWRAVFGFSKGVTVTVEELQQRFRQKLKAAHPDVGGTDEMMMHLNRAREYAIGELEGNA